MHRNSREYRGIYYCYLRSCIKRKHTEDKCHVKCHPRRRSAPNTLGRASSRSPLRRLREEDFCGSLVPTKTTSRNGGTRIIKLNNNRRSRVFRRIIPITTRTFADPAAAGAPEWGATLEPLTLSILAPPSRVRPRDRIMTLITAGTILVRHDPVSGRGCSSNNSRSNLYCNNSNNWNTSRGDPDNDLLRWISTPRWDFCGNRIKRLRRIVRWRAAWVPRRRSQRPKGAVLPDLHHQHRLRRLRRDRPDPLNPFPGNNNNNAARLRKCN